MNKLCPFPPHPQKGLFCELPNSAETSWPIVEDTFRLCSYCKWLLSHGGCPRFSCHVGEICLRHKPTSPRHPPFIQSLPLMVPFPSPGSQLARSQPDKPIHSDWSQAPRPLPKKEHFSSWRSAGWNPEAETGNGQGDKQNKQRWRRKSLLPNKLGCENGCRISELGISLCFSFLKSEMG